MPPAGVVLYDDSCGICRKWVPFWRKTLARRGFAIGTLQSEVASRLTGVAEGHLLDDLRLVFPDGQHIAGADVYRHVLRRIPWAHPIAILANAPLLSRVFDAAYRSFAGNRHRISKACALPPRTTEPPPK